MLVLTGRATFRMVGKREVDISDVCAAVQLPSGPLERSRLAADATREANGAVGG